MADPDYAEQLEQLHSGQVDEIVIHPDQFMAFQQAFQKYPYRSQIEGDAKHGGEIHYHLIQKGTDSK